MADGVDLTFDEAAFAQAGDRIVRQHLSAGTQAIAVTTKRLERKLEAATREAVPGKLWRAWQSSAFPERGPARAPVGTIWLKGGKRTRGAVTFWTQPGAIRGQNGQYLAIPLPAAGARGRSRDLTPGEWERANGQRLRFIYRQGKPSILAAIGGTINGRTKAFRPLTAGKRGRAAQGRGGANPQVDSVVPIFVLLPMVAFRNAFAIQPLINASEGELAKEFFDAVRSLG